MPESDATPSQPILSDYRHDTDLAELVELFVSEMPERLETLLAAFDQGDLERVRVESHRLRGAGSGYGFPILTEAAAKVEDGIRDEFDATNLQAAFDDLVSLCQRVK